MNEKFNLHAHWEYVHKHRGGFRRVKGLTDEGEYVEVTIDDTYEEDRPKCSNCHRYTEEIDPVFCPHCGACMDEEV